MRIRILITFSLLFALIWSASCRKDFDYAPSAGNLSFSKDTVFLDTVFAEIGSSTFILKVYNNTRDDVIIPSISLKNGSESFYRLNVDGVAGKKFTRITIYAQDSLFILIETTIAITDESNELLYTDVILFDNEPHQQSVELITLARDAIFLFPMDETGREPETVALYTDDAGNQIEVTGFKFKDEELNFTNNKAYVIYGYGIVPEEKELIIDAGARVYFHKNSGIIVENGAVITVNGTLSENEELLEGEVVFEGDRLEPEYSEIPGQWGALWIRKGSTNNSLNHLTIRNAEIGLFAEGESNLSAKTLTIKNSQIYNNSRHNIWSNNAKIVAENLILGGAGSSALLCENGGSYSFTHCTIANYWNKGFRTNAALEIKNSASNNLGTGFDLIQADFKNCIIDGNNLSEVSLIPNGENIFNFNFKNSFIKFSLSQPSTELNDLYNFVNSEFYFDVIINGSVDYFHSSENNFKIGLASEVIGKGDLNTANSVPFDIIGTQRSSAPDLGAFQAKERE
ncbi:right-handed parallel beta-helix repeat-containing protein [Maribacter sp. ACAM166]|uniref:right-handed parallel beta-helix repeat-containing protein n=1 Tax=Maribacter sp. ACAM166 TaxID=2508996 RepID=UPI0010FCF2D7|nr:right-handed parallel beta-helix repeat-containing protein [Maribacter sp. ACAM166]TLP81308.1 hypothetical protein ES765_04670 [Maribacter sp. ACAM166]